MMLLAAIGNGSFVFAVFILFWWHPNTPFDVRVGLAGIYLIVTTIAVAAVCVLTRLDESRWSGPR